MLQTSGGLKQSEGQGRQQQKIAQAAYGVWHRGVARHKALLGHRPLTRATHHFFSSSKLAAYKKCAIQCTIQTFFCNTLHAKHFHVK